jgi:hypothetical protein
MDAIDYRYLLRRGDEAPPQPARIAAAATALAASKTLFGDSNIELPSFGSSYQ